MWETQQVKKVRLFTGIDFDVDTRENVTNAMYASLGLHRHG